MFDDAHNEKRQLDRQTASQLLGRLMLDEAADGEGNMPGLPRIPGYRLHKRVDSGGTADVFLGRCEGNDQAVAVKIIRAPQDGSRSSKRVWRELDALSDVRLPCVPAVFDYGLADGRFFIVTPFIQGMKLDRFAAERQLYRRARVELMAVVCDAVQQVHEHGLIHRDLKPDNIIVRPDGTPVIIDFGIARLIDHDGQETVSREGAPIGTVAYMAPEQARGEQSMQSTRSDIYSLGAIACVLLTGRTPHDVGTAEHEAIRRVAQEPARDPRKLDPGLPPVLGRIIGRALEFEAANRYASAADMARDLRRWLNNEPIDWQPTSAWSRMRLAAKRNPVRFMGAATVSMAILAVLATGIAITQWNVAAAERANKQRAEQLFTDQLALQDERDKLIVEKTEFAVQAEKERAFWEEEARKREEWRINRAAYDASLIALLERQVKRVEAAVESGPLFDATIALLSFAEEVEAISPDDQAMLRRFVEYFGQLVDAARASAPSPSEP